MKTFRVTFWSFDGLACKHFQAWDIFGIGGMASSSGIDHSNIISIEIVPQVMS